jgi:uncharacterized protein YdeI (YjbR/CyaY-like superfamily)
MAMELDRDHLVALRQQRQPWFEHVNRAQAAMEQQHRFAFAMDLVVVVTPLASICPFFTGAGLLVSSVVISSSLIQLTSLVRRRTRKAEIDAAIDRKEMSRMAPVIPDPRKVKSFRTEAAFAAWMKANHARETELWLKIHKKGSGLPTVTYAQALDVALCWGWIDGTKKSFDARSFLQRYSPRRARSVWSQINRDHVARLAAAGRMTPHGQQHVDAAKADGRWDAAYAPLRHTSAATIPADLREAIEANAKARKTFRTLDRANLFALVFRTNNMKTPAGRARKIAALVAMLARGQTVIPERPPTPAKGRRPRSASPP